MKNNRSLEISLISAVLLVPITLLVGKVVEYLLKSFNPSQVNIASGLAYLAPILYIGMATFALVFVVGIVSGLRALKGPNKQLAKLCLVLLVIELLVTVAALLLQQASTMLIQ